MAAPWRLPSSSRLWGNPGTHAHTNPTSNDATAAAGRWGARGKLSRQTLLATKPEPGCIICHLLEPRVVLVGPALMSVAKRSTATIQQPDYMGQAQRVEEYLHERITTHSGG